MMRSRRIGLMLLGYLGLLLALWPAVGVEAKGAFDLLVVCDAPATCFEVTDPSLLGFFSLADLTRPLEDDLRPEPEAGFSLITRYSLDRATGESIAFDRLRYYAGVAESEGYVFYEGLIGGSSEYDGRWYRARAGLAAALRESEEAARTNPGPTTGSRLGWGAFAALAGGGVGGAALLRRSRAAREAAKRPLG